MIDTLVNLAGSLGSAVGPGGRRVSPPVNADATWDRIAQAEQVLDRAGLLTPEPITLRNTPEAQRARTLTDAIRAKGRSLTSEEFAALMPQEAAASREQARRDQMNTYAEQAAAASRARAGESLATQVGRDFLGGVVDLTSSIPGTLAAGAGAVGLDGAADALGGVAASLRAEASPGPYDTLSGRGLLGAAVRTAPQLVVGAGVGGAVAAAGKGAVATLAAFAGTQVAPVVGQSFIQTKQQLIQGRPDLPVDEVNRLSAAKAATDGAVTFATNMVAGPLVSKTPIGRWLVGTEAGKGILGKVGESALGRFGVAGLMEGSQEVTEWLGQEAAQAIIVDPNLPPELRTAYANAGPEALANFLVGGVLGGFANLTFEEAARAPRSGRADNSGPDQGLPVEDAPQQPDPGEPLAEAPSVQPTDDRRVEDMPAEPVNPPADGALPTDSRRVEAAPAATVEERAAQVLAQAREMGLQDGRDGAEPEDTSGLDPEIAREYARAYRTGQKESSRGDRPKPPPADGVAEVHPGGMVTSDQPDGRPGLRGDPAQERAVATDRDAGGEVRAVAPAVEPVVGDQGVEEGQAKPEAVGMGVGASTAPAESSAPLETGGEGGTTPEQRAKIGEVIAQARASGARNDRYADHTPVSDAEAERIGVLTGLDVRGYTHSIDVSGVRHVLGGHTNPAVEQSRGQEPVTANDLLAVPSVVSSPDLITPGPNTKSGLKTIVFRKRVNGHMLAVEEVRTGRKKLMLATLWKERAPGRVNAREESRPTADAQSVSPDGSTSESIGHNPPEGKPAGENPQPGLFDQIEQAARERIKKRRLPGKPGDRASGAGLIFEEIVDRAIIAAARVAKAGVATYRAIRRTAKAVLEERGQYTDEDLRLVARETGKIIRESGEGFADLELAVESAQKRKADKPTAAPPSAPRRERLKALIARTSGMTDSADAKTVSERDALRAAMRAQQRAAREATRAEREAGNVRLVAKMREVRWDRLTAQNARRKAVKLIRKYAPASLAKKYLGFVARARNEESAQALYAKISADVAAYRMKLAKVESDSALRAANPKKLLAELREQVRQAKKEQTRILTALQEAQAKATTAKAEATKLQDSAARADRLAEISGELVRTVNELREQLVTKVRNVAREARATQRHWETVLSEGKLKSRVDVVEDARYRMSKVPDMPLQGIVKRDPEAPLWKRFMRSMVNRDTLAAVLGDGPLGSMLTHAIYDGQRKMMADEVRGENARRAILEKHGFAWGDVDTRRLSAFAEGNRAIRVTHTLPSGHEITATPAEWGELYAIVTDLDAREKILGGTPIKMARAETEPEIRLNRADVRFIERTVDPEIRAIVDELKADFQKNVSPGERASYREHNGYDMPIIEGYWHTRRRAEKGGTTGLIGDYTPGAATLASTSMWKDRVENPGKAPYLIGDVFQTHAKMIREAAARTHLNQPVRALQVVLRDSGMQRDIRRKFGPDLFSQLALFAEQSAVILRPPPTSQSPGFIGRLAQQLQRNLSRAYLSISPSAVLKNLGGTFKLLSVMPSKYVAKAVAQGAMTDRNLYQRMLEGSAFLNDRHGAGVAVAASAQLGETSDVLGPLSVKDAGWRLQLGALTDRLPFFGWGDSRPSVVAWRAAELQVEAEHPDWSADQKARWVARTAEDAVRFTQNPHTTIDAGYIQAKYRGTPLSLLIMFKSDGIQSLNMLASSYIRNGPRSRQFARAVGGVALNTAFAAAVTVALREGFKYAAALAAGNEDDERYQKGRRDFASAFARELLANTFGMPYGGAEAYEIGEATYNAFAGNPRRPLDTSVSPVLRVMGEVLTKGAESAGALGDYLLRSETDEQAATAYDRLMKNLESMATSGSAMVGLPIVPVYSLGKRAVRGATERADPSTVYSAVSDRIARGETEEASDILALVVRQHPLAERSKAYLAAVNALRRRGPDGELTDRQRVELWTGLPADQRTARARAYAEWRSMVAKVAADAVRKSAAAKTQPEDK